MKALEQKAFFIYLFPVFFYLLGITEYGQYVNLWDIVKEVLLFEFIVVVLFYVSNKFFQKQDNAVANIFFISLALYSFFGDIKKALSAHNITSFISSYTVLMPLIFVTLILLFQVGKRNKKVGQQLFVYFNYLMIMLCVLQSILARKTLLSKDSTMVQSLSLDIQAVKEKPNVYFILLDAYAGNTSLKTYFHYDNNDLISKLQAQQFYVFDSIHSNYNITAGSVNSMLNMQYINQAKLAPWNQYSFYLKSFNFIHENKVTRFFHRCDYQLYNYSLFDIESAPASYSFPLLHKGIDLIHARFLHQKLVNDLAWKLCIGKFKLNYFFNKYTLHVHHQNNDIIQKTMKLAKQQNDKPHFVYAHLLLPHQPYFTDSLGNVLDIETQEKNKYQASTYLQYLQYANSRIQEMAKSIVHADPNSIIVFISDHGYPDYPKAAQGLVFNNFMAIHVPDNKYSQLQNIKSNVHLFPVLLNTYFHQQIPLQKDSLFLIDEERNMIRNSKL